MNVGEFLAETLEPLWRMTPSGHSRVPLLLDRSIKFVPVTDGFALPEFYRWLLLPFSERPVSGLHSVFDQVSHAQVAPSAVTALMLWSLAAFAELPSLCCLHVVCRCESYIRC